MKKVFSHLVCILALFGCASQSDMENLDNQVEDIKSNQIASIEEQITNITSSLKDLQDLYELLDGEDTSLGDRIDEIKQYVEQQLPLLREWSEATFSTLEQYQSTCEELATIKTSISTLETSLRNLVDEKIGILENSLKGWVNEKLTGYWTIAETEAKLNLLSQKDDENLLTLRTEIESAKQDLTTAYRNEIKEAVESSEGKLSAQIDSINQQLLAKISSIETRLDAIEARLDELEKVFSIVFIDAEGLACMPGKSLRVNYVLVNSTGECQIECIGDNGWRGEVEQETSTTGYIIVSAPDLAQSGKILVFAHCGNKMAMKALLFDSGVLNVTDAYNIGWQGAQFAVPVEYNVEFSVDCGTSTWVSFEEEPPTKAAVLTKNYVLTVDENPEDSPARTATIKLFNKLGQQIKAISVYQELSPTSNPISFTDQYVRTVCLEKFDSNKDGEVSYFEVGKVTNLEKDFFGEYKPAVTSFNELQYFVSLNTIPDECFSNVSRLTSIVLPSGITLIGKRAFYGCTSLQDITLSPALETIDGGAFSFCSALQTFSFPSSLKVIGESAFANCTSLQRIALNEGLVSIGGSAFYSCQAVDSVYVPTTLKSNNSGFVRTTGKAEIHGAIPSGTINTGAYRDSYFTEIIIGDDVSSIGDNAFYQSHNTTKVTVGKNVASIGASAFDFYSTKPIYYFRRFLPVNSCPADYSKIYVPEGSKEIYMAAQGWPSSESVYEEFVVE